MGFGRGPGFLLDGMRLWRRRPALMLFGMIPAVIAAALVITLLVLLTVFADDFIAWATPFADDWSSGARRVFRGLLFLIVLVGAAVLAILTFTGLTLAIGDPFYERVWKQVEISLGGEIPAQGVGWLRGAVDGVILMAMGLLTAALVFALGLVPVIGTMIGAGLGLVLGGRLLARELVSRPLQARGMDRTARDALMAPHRGALLGFGVAVQACFLVPLGAIVVMPAAVAGATYLARAALEGVGGPEGPAA